MKFTLTEAFRRNKPIFKRWWEILVDFDKRISTLEGNSSEQSDEPAVYDLSFTINDGTNPINGATVTIGETTGTTGSAGGCTLNNIGEGSQTVEVSAEGYVTKTESITVSSDNTSFTINLTINE